MKDRKIKKRYSAQEIEAIYFHGVFMGAVSITGFLPISSKQLEHQLKDVLHKLKHGYKAKLVVENNEHSINTKELEGRRYPMTKDQAAQIDCRNESCKFYKGGGTCSNISPAITLNSDGKFVCWSEQLKADKKELKTEQTKEKSIFKDTVIKCIEFTDEKFKHYYEEAKRVGEFDPIKEQEYVRAAMALKELKDEFWELQKRRADEP